MLRKARGFTLVELLIVVAIVGIIAAIAIPNLLNALNRGRQKRTMADMRSIGTAIEAYAVDMNRPPLLTAAPVDGNLDGYLEPLYMKKCPDEDAWGHPFIYLAASSEQTGPDSEYALVSLGRNGQPDTVLLFSLGVERTMDFDADIVFIGGQFRQWPEGQQQ